MPSEQDVVGFSQFILQDPPRFQLWVYFQNKGLGRFGIIIQS